MMKLKPLTLTLLLFAVSAVTLAQTHTLHSHYDYQLLSPEGKALTLSSLPDAIIKADVVLVGEWHSHSATHRFQSDLYRELLHVNQQVDLSMEQFSRPAQKTLDQYLSGEIGELALIAHGKAWPNYTSDYRAVVEQAKSADRKVIAANAPRDIVHCIGQVGPDYLDGLSKEERDYIASSLDTTDRPYKQRFMSMMPDMEEKALGNMYAAQIAWDETMAESITRHLKQNPGTQVVHTAGKFHVEKGEGIAYSILQRNPDLDVVLITPVTETRSDQSSALKEYQLLVLPIPEQRIQSHHGDYTHPEITSRSKCK